MAYEMDEHEVAFHKKVEQEEMLHEIKGIILQYGSDPKVIEYHIERLPYVKEAKARIEKMQLLVDVDIITETKRATFRMEPVHYMLDRMMEE